MPLPTPRGKKPVALHTRVLRLVLSGLMGALLVVSKQAMSGLPNIEPVTLLVILFALELPRETPGAVTVFILLQGARNAVPSRRAKTVENGNPRWQSSRCSSRSAAPASVQGAAMLVHRITAGSAHRTAASGRSSQDSGSSVRAGIIQSASHSAPPGPAGLPGIGASGRRRGRSPPAGGGKFCPPPTWEGPAAPLF